MAQFCTVISQFLLLWSVIVCLGSAVEELLGQLEITESGNGNGNGNENGNGNGNGKLEKVVRWKH